MRTRPLPAATAAVAVVLFTLALTACGSDSGTAPRSGSTSRQTPATDSQSATPDGNSFAAPRPNAAQSRKLLDRLRAIDPALADQGRTAVQHSVVTCEALANGVPRAEVVKQAGKEFGGGNKAVDTAEANRIVTAVQKTFCTA
ncbi:hypothetical protein [Wenjunlia tyrosinilytica]|uniref:DUF732 domain-containing protein n=1 Tax=Wenjunlia tyrosinilytica TaxID=1544741 RepID=A0A918DRV4_9ACTN|nr:hypothetical protein [Wenjunlia tyrosinilytica]GGO80413.1 hypothetical protein GCM10012280_02270 [Wenjunlia tyrosinilytica]